MIHGGKSGKAARVVCALLAFVLLVIAAYVFSGFHRHDPFSTKACSFSQFERGSSLEAGSTLHFHPRIECRWHASEVRAERPPAPDVMRAGGRAPPQFS
jgi:hypothetical protein